MYNLQTCLNSLSIKYVRISALPVPRVPLLDKWHSSISSYTLDYNLYVKLHPL